MRTYLKKYRWGGLLSAIMVAAFFAPVTPTASAAGEHTKTAPAAQRATKKWPVINPRETKLLKGAKMEEDLTRATRLHGTLHNGAGHVMGRKQVRVFLHYPLARVRPVAYCKTGPAGYFSGCVIHHSTGLAAFAANHRGRLNLDITVFGPGARLEWATIRTIIYAHPLVQMGLLHLRLVHHVVYKGKAKFDPDMLPPQEGGDKYTWLSQDRMQAARHVDTNYTLGETFSTSVTSGIGIPGESFTLSGSVTTKGAHGSEEGSSFTGSNSTRVLKRRVNMTADRSCYKFRLPQNPVLYTNCQMEINGEWTSGIHAFRAQKNWVNCFAQSHNDIWTKGVDEVRIHRKFSAEDTTASAAIDLPGVNLNASTSWGTSESQTFVFHWELMSRGTKGCLGGATNYWQDAAYVAVSTQLP